MIEELHRYHVLLLYIGTKYFELGIRMNTKREKNLYAAVNLSRKIHGDN